MSTILVASDAPTVRRQIRSTIAGPGLEIEESNSGPQVVERCLSVGPPDLVVVDLQMGNMGGMAVCLELRLNESYLDIPHVAVLMLLDRRPDVFLARRSGAEGWLVKPLDPRRLRAAVRALLSGGTYHDEAYLPVPVLVGESNALPTGAAD